MVGNENLCINRSNGMVALYVARFRPQYTSNLSSEPIHYYRRLTKHNQTTMLILYACDDRN
uniref:Uncharacterized protein n=1 Tax=Romanomermis culicivorax TaxID=13658 RepID=A0A915J3X8_ROMCU